MFYRIIYFMMYGYGVGLSSLSWYFEFKILNGVVHIFKKIMSNFFSTKH